MKTRSFGVTLLLCSLIIGAITLNNPEIQVRLEKFAKTDTGENLEGQIVMVPPWNASEEETPRGWVGFNVILDQAEKSNYGAKGLIATADANPQSKVVMRAVNITGVIMLELDFFDEATWNATTIYAAAFLDGEYGQLSHEFTFSHLDNSSKYVLLFRGLRNETQDRPIMISIKEIFYEPGKLLDQQASNVCWTVSLTTSIAGVILLVKKPKSSMKLLKKRGK